MFGKIYRPLLLGLLTLLLIGSALPSLLPTDTLKNLPPWWADNHLQLGLDLSGGSQLTMAIDTDELLTSHYQNLVDNINKESRSNRLTVTAGNISAEGFVLHAKDDRDAEKLVKITSQILQREGFQENAYTMDLEDATVSVRLKNPFAEQLIADALEKSHRIIELRLNASGVVEPSIYRQGDTNIVIQMPGLENPERIRELVGSTAKLSFHWLAKPGGSVPIQVLPDPINNDKYTLEKPVALAGEHVRDARLGFDQNNNEPIVLFHLDPVGTEIFAELTQNGIGRQLAIVLDNKVMSAPVIRSVIAGGQGEISGNFTAEQASDLALVLRTGALPAKLIEIERYSVGPQLGSDAISAGLIAGLLGAVLVIAMIGCLYRRWSLLSCANLAFTLLTLFAVLGFLRATLTLPGIAGIILTLGMAVDANILINERIREEIIGGAKNLSAVQHGFQRAWGTILDANITTLIAVVLLFLVGQGAIRGFAVVMAIGIGATLLSTRCLAKPAMEWIIRRQQRKTHGWLRFTPLPRFIANLQNSQLLRRPWLGLVISLILSSASVALLSTQGLNLGVDFSGGTQIKIYHTDLQPDNLRAYIDDVQQIQALNDGSLQFRMAAEADNNGAKINALQEQISAAWPNAEFDISSISAQVSADFFNMGLIALLIAGVGVIIYLWARYENYFAGAAITTLVLDLTKTLGFLVLVGLEFNLITVAALLALIGYSINDKVVVFDRIRENLQKTAEPDLKTIINQSIGQTLSRTLFTSISTAIAILPMAIAGGTVVAQFAIPLLFGIVVGTSSSIFIAAPLILHFGGRRLSTGQHLLQKSNEELREDMA